MPPHDDSLRALSELTEAGMGFVRRLSAALETAEDTATLCDVTEAFCDVSRSVRQSIALSLRIESGSFAVQRMAPQAAERDPDAAPEERPDRAERADWNEYERPDWETPLRLTGDEAEDAEAVRAAVETAVTRIRRSYAKAEAALTPPPVPAPAPRLGRAALLAGTAPLRRTDSS